MDYFWIDMDWDAKGNSPWDALWYKDDDALRCLSGSHPLAAIWKPPAVKRQKRRQRPDVYSFVLHYAVVEAVRKLWAPIVRKEVEFLPLAVANLGPLYIVHPLWPVDFDEGAEVSRSGRGNITLVQKYSFTLNPDHYPGPRHIFRMRQAPGSPARDHGSTMTTLIVSEKVKRASEKANLTGIVFKFACTA